MKRIVFLILSICLATLSYGQSVNPSNDYSFKGQANFGSGVDTFKATTPSAWVQLGNIGTTKGLLMPRVFDTADIANPTDGLQCYQLSDHTNYSYKVNKWVAIGSGSGGTVDTVSTIGDLEAYSGSANILLVTDSMRGGIFYKQDAGYTADNGVVFASADGKEWIRSYNQGLGVNAAWYGLNPYDGNADDSAINEAITSVYNNGIVNINEYSTDTVYLAHSVIMQDNTKLLVGSSTYIKLMNGSNCYVLRNADFYNGNVNITVNGGIWDANGLNNTALRINNALTLNTDYYGYGFAFCRVDGLTVEDLSTKNNYAWSIAYFVGDHTTFKNINIHATLGQFHNGDGITGYSDNLLIDGITGYSNDDLIGLNLGTNGAVGVISSAGGYWPRTGTIHNATIQNIHGTFYDSAHLSQPQNYPWRLVRIMAISSDTLYNVNVRNVHGYSNGTPIIIMSTYSAGDFTPGYMVNVSIQDVSVAVKSPGTDMGLEPAFICVLPTKLKSFYFGNITVLPHAGNYPVFQFQNVYCDNVTMSSVNSIVPAGSWYPFIEDTASYIKNYSISNVYHSDSLLANDMPLYRKAPGAGDITTHLQTSNIVLSPKADIVSGSGLISLKGVSFPSDTTLLTPEAGDYVNDPNFGYQIYLNGKWKQGGTDYGTFSFSGNGTTTSFTAPISPGFTPSKIVIQSTSADAEKAKFYVDPATISATAFTIVATGVTPPAGTNNGTLYYKLVP